MMEEKKIINEEVTNQNKDFNFEEARDVTYRLYSTLARYGEYKLCSDTLKMSINLTLSAMGCAEDTTEEDYKYLESEVAKTALWVDAFDSGDAERIDQVLKEMGGGLA